MKTLEGGELCFPQLLNTSCRKLKRPHLESMLIHTLLSSISLLTVSLNLLVVISISHFKQLHTPTNLLLLSLAVSDFIVGFILVFEHQIIDGCWLLGDLVCVLYQYLAFIITSVSVGNMVMISVDRYVAICDPLHYSTKVTLKRVRICVCLCWVCSVSFQSLNMKDVLKQPGRYHSCSGQCVIVINYLAGFADLVLTFVVPIVVIVVLYMRVFAVAVSQARAVAAVTHQFSVSVNVKKSEMKAARTLGVVVTVFVICLSPYFFVNVIGQGDLSNAQTATFVVCLFYFNSCVNPLIYAFFYPWFRKSVKLIVTLKILRKDSCKTNML